MGSRRCLIDRQHDLDNLIRAVIRTFGLKIGVIGQSKFEARVRELTAEDGDLETAIAPLLEARRTIREQARLLTRMIEGLVRKDICRRLMTAPGVGPLTALAFKTAINDPHRFRKSRHVGVHLGLTPRKYASGEVDYNGRITRCGDDFLRKSLRSGAFTADQYEGMECAESLGGATCQA